ncbi:MAG: DUF4407 domain-containing protein [Thiotrichaceae bacterium]|nr:DUF4407 domain-containing protein [Thiotrichaceae bacterium]
MRNFFLALSGTNREVLEQCGSAEKQKYTVVGLSVFIPAIMAFIAAHYIISTMTDNDIAIWLVSVFWALLIFLLDIGLLVTYRPDSKSLIIFRFFMAVCLGFVISHPLVLKIFDDEIQARINEKRIEEIKSIRQQHEEQRKILHSTLDQARKSQQAAIDNSSAELNKYEGSQVNQNDSSGTTLQTDDYKRLKSDFQAKIDGFRTEQKLKRQDIEKKRADLADEVAGKGRTRKNGHGPVARSLETDIQRLSSEISQLDEQIGAIESKLNSLAASELQSIKKAEDDRREKMTATQIHLQEIRKQQLALALQKGNAQVNAENASIAQIETKLANLLSQENKAIKNIEENKLQGVLVKTLVLDKLIFSDKGGWLAGIIYILFTVIFILLDTAAILIKYFAYYSGSLYDLVLKNYNKTQQMESDEKMSEITQKINDKQHERSAKSYICKSKIDKNKDDEIERHTHETNAETQSEIAKKLHALSLETERAKLAADLQYQSFQTVSLSKASHQSTQNFIDNLNARINSIKPDEKIDELVSQREEQVRNILIDQYYDDHESFINDFFEKKSYKSSSSS